MTGQRPGRWCARATRLAALALLSHTQGAAVLVLSPEIAADLGTSTVTVGACAALPMAAAVVAVLPLAAAPWVPGRRGRLAVAGAVIGALATIGTAAVSDLWGLVAASAIAGSARAAVQALHPPLLVESTGTAPMRALSVHAFGDRLGSFAIPLGAGAAVALLDLDWRTVLLTLGTGSLLVALCGRPPVDAAPAEPRRRSVRFVEAARGVLVVPTARTLIQGCSVAGAVLVPFGAALLDHLETGFGLDALERGALLAGPPVAGLVTLSLLAPWLDRLFVTAPARVLQIASVLFTTCVTAVAAAGLVSTLPAMVVALAVAFAALAPVPPAVLLCLMHVVRTEQRTTAAALAGLAVFVVGAPVGLLLIADAAERGGTGAALAVTALPGLLLAVLLPRAARTLPADLRRDAAGAGLPVDGGAERIGAAGLVCRGVEFGYDGRPVLRGADLHVAAGEVVALCGGNGVGKSTLLRVLAGLETPARGVVLLDGEDVTYLAAQRRAAAGVQLVRGGRAVFLPLTVEDNLRVWTAAAGAGRGAGERAVQAVLGSVPLLAARRQVRAQALSGGERQLLGLVRALLAPPRLLLVDELSLGLSAQVLPAVLATVRSAADQGAAVLVVDHNPTVVSAVADRACRLVDGRLAEESTSRDPDRDAVWS